MHISMHIGMHMGMHIGMHMGMHMPMPNRMRMCSDAPSHVHRYVAVHAALQIALVCSLWFPFHLRRTLNHAGTMRTAEADPPDL